MAGRQGWPERQGRFLREAHRRARAGERVEVTCRGACPAVSLAKGVEGVGAVDGDPKVGPVDVPMRPCRHGAVGQEQGEVRGADGVALAPTADSQTGGKGDQPDVVQPSGAGHRPALPRDRGMALASADGGPALQARTGLPFTLRYAPSPPWPDTAILD